MFLVFLANLHSLISGYRKQAGDRHVYAPQARLKVTVLIEYD